MVFFNAGSLLKNVTKILNFDPKEYKQNYKLQPWAKWNYSRKTIDQIIISNLDEKEDRQSIVTSSLSSTSFSSMDEEDTMLLSSIASSTIRDYKSHFNLSIGLYTQEFAIDEVATNLIVSHVNQNADVYNLGFSWGGLNEIMVKGINPGRFNCTDGFWSQRYGSTSWNCELYPNDDFR